MPDPKISLVICAYNEENYIGACLEHALKESAGRFFEVIVIDNASTDNTRAIAERFPGVRVVREEKKGLTMARERGFQEAKGDIIAYIDADTRMPEGWFNNVAKAFENKEVASFSGPYIYYDIPRWQQNLVKLYWRVLVVPGYWATGYMVIGGNFAIRKEALKAMGGFDTSIAFYGEDADIGRRVHKVGQSVFDASHVMYTSGRRLAGQGLLKTAGLYTINFISDMFLHKPATKEYKDIR